MTRPGSPLLTYPPGKTLLAQRPPLPSTVVDYWHSEIQCTPTSWRGQITGLNLTNTAGTPTVAADGANFNGRVVAQCTPSAYWSNNGAPWPSTILPVGSKVWEYGVARIRSISGTGVLYHTTSGGGSFFSAITVYQSKWCHYHFNHMMNSGATADTQPHRFTTWLDGAKSHMDIDATHYEWASTDALSAYGAYVHMNGLGGYGYHCNPSIACRIICRDKPSAAEIAALDAWSAGYWGVP